MNSKKLLSLLFLLFGHLIGFSQFTPGNLVVLQAGDATNSLANTGNRIVLKEFTPFGAPGFSLAITSSNEPLIIAGTAVSEGMLNLSANGKYLVFGGYATTFPYGSSLSGESASNLNRGVGIVDGWGSYDRVAVHASFFSGSSIRSATSDGLGNYWSGGGSSGTAYFGTVAVSVAVQNSNTNTRHLALFNNGMYFSTGSGTQGIYKVGNAYPVTAGQSTTLTINTSTVGTGQASPFAFYFNPTQTLCYVADDRSFVNGGGVQKWTYTNGAWSYLYNLSVGGSSGARGVVVDFSGTNTLVYATTDESSANRIVVINDVGATSSVTTLATSTPSTIFRGIAFTPSCLDPQVTAITSGTVCQGKTFTLTPTVAGDPAIAYMWSGPFGFFSNQPEPVLMAPASGVYSLTVVNGCGSVTATHSVIVNPIPALNVNPNPGIICPGGTVTLLANGASSYTWSTGALTFSISESPANTTTYSLTGISAQGCIGTATTAIVVVNSVVVSVPPVTVCPGATATLTAAGASSFSWMPFNVTGQTFTLTPLSSTSLSVSGSAPGCPFAASTTVQITVAPLPTISVNPASVCLGGTVTLAASGGMNYNWGAFGSGPVIFVTPSVSTVYTVTGSSAQGCSSTAQTTVTVYPNPTTTLSIPETTICNNALPQTFTGTPSGGFFQGPGMNGDQFNPSAASLGTILIEYQYTDNNNCPATDAQTLTVISCTTVSLPEFTGAKAWNVYPVPSHDEITVSAEYFNGTTVLTIYNSVGIKVGEMPMSSESTQVDIRDYTPGLYFIRIGNRILRFVKD